MKLAAAVPPHSRLHRLPRSLSHSPPSLSPSPTPSLAIASLARLPVSSLSSLAPPSLSAPSTPSLALASLGSGTLMPATCAAGLLVWSGSHSDSLAGQGLPRCPRRARSHIQTVWLRQPRCPRKSKNNSACLPSADLAVLAQLASLASFPRSACCLALASPTLRGSAIFLAA